MPKRLHPWLCDFFYTEFNPSPFETGKPDPPQLPLSPFGYFIFLLQTRSQRHPYSQPPATPPFPWPKTEPKNQSSPPQLLSRPLPHFSFPSTWLPFPSPPPCYSFPQTATVTEASSSPHRIQRSSTITQPPCSLVSIKSTRKTAKKGRRGGQKIETLKAPISQPW